MISLILILLIAGEDRNAFWTDGTFINPDIIEITERHDPAFQPTGILSKGNFQIGDEINFWAIDYFEDPVYGTFYLLPATCRFAGEDTYIFVENDVWGDYFNEEDVVAFAVALEDSVPADSGGIIEINSATFGPIPDEIDGDPRVFFLVLNIRDGWTGEPGHETYIGGYFSPYNQFTEQEAYLYYGGHSNEVEMLYIDCYPAEPEDALYTSSHELVHLIQWGIKPFSGEDLWVIENQAQSGPFVCGYGVDQVTTFLDVGGVTPVGWTDLQSDSEYVAGYGAGYLFFGYLYENYGGSNFLWNSMRSEEKGLAGIAEAISDATGLQPDVNSILDDWMIANWVDDVSVGDGRFGYESFKISDFDVFPFGNRRGLDYRDQVEELPFFDAAHSLSSHTINCYQISGETGSGTIRAFAEGLGYLSACFISGSETTSVERLDTGCSNEVALLLPADGELLLMCSSFFSLLLEIAADDPLENASDFLLYPSPCLGKLHLEFYSNGEPAEFSVFDVTGRFIETVNLGTVDSGHALWIYNETEGFSTGTYFFRFVQGDRIEVGKFAVIN